MRLDGLRQGSTATATGSDALSPHPPADSISLAPAAWPFDASSERGRALSAAGLEPDQVNSQVNMEGEGREEKAAEPKSSSRAIVGSVCTHADSAMHTPIVSVVKFVIILLRCVTARTGGCTTRRPVATRIGW
jgi:hypothetical protein